MDEINPKEVAIALIKNGYGEEVEKNLSYFSDINDRLEIIKELFIDNPSKNMRERWERLVRIAKEGGVCHENSNS